MRHFLKIATVLSLAVAALAAIDVSPARADANAAVCAQTYGKSDGLSCNYASYDQCRAYVSGLGGSCISNPFFRDARNEMPRARVRR